MGISGSDFEPYLVFFWDGSDNQWQPVWREDSADGKIVHREFTGHEEAVKKAHQAMTENGTHYRDRFLTVCVGMGTAREWRVKTTYEAARR